MNPEELDKNTVIDALVAHNHAIQQLKEATSGLADGLVHFVDVFAKRQRWQFRFNVAMTVFLLAVTTYLIVREISG